MAKPKLALIPAAQGSKFYSVLPSDGVGDFDFARASAATRINKYGLIETVASGQSRLNYPLIDGVVKGCPHHILEPLRTQLIQYSEDFSNWASVFTVVNLNEIVSPDGSVNATKLTDTSDSSTHRIQVGNTTSSSGNFCYSVFLKKGTLTTVALNVFSGTTVADSKFDLDNGTIVSTTNGTAEIQEYGNDWYRCIVKGTLVSTSTTTYIYLKEKASYSGSSQFLYAWGAQLEEGSYPTSYIPNFGTALGVTRSAETANNSGDASTFNDSEGVLMVEAAALSNDGTYRNICLSDGGLTNRILIQYTPTSNQINIVVIYSGGQYSLSHTVSNVKDFSKFLIKYKANDLALWVNGFEVDTSANSNLPIGLNTLSFDNTIGDAFYSNTKQIQYFDSALNDSELETLTSWTSFSEMATSQLYSIQ
jgi:hypothetical protein